MLPRAQAVNLAALQQLPIIFVCENNQFAMGTATGRGSFDEEYYARGQYIPGIQVSRRPFAGPSFHLATSSQHLGVFAPFLYFLWPTLSVGREPG